MINIHVTLLAHFSFKRTSCQRNTRISRCSGFFIYFIVWLKTLRNSHLIQFVTNLQ